MSYEDEIEDEISNLKHQVMFSSNGDEVVEKYFKFKRMIFEKQCRYWEYLNQNFNNEVEGHYYDILERCICFDIEDSLITEQELANILKIDSGLKKYCEEHTDNDGLIGILKYKQQIRKKELIKRALEIVN